MTRRALSNRDRMNVWIAAKGICHLCGLKIHAEHGEQWDVEHVKPLWLDGADTGDNLLPAHVKCHRAKTVAEATVRAKSDRVRQKHVGAYRPRHAMPCGRLSKWKKKLNGEVVPR